MALTSTVVFQTTINITNGVITRIPATGGVTVPTNRGFVSLTLQINLTTAQKEAGPSRPAPNNVINTLEVGLFRAPGDTFVGGFPGTILGDGVDYGDWASYDGPFTTPANGQAGILDPDPQFTVPVSAIAGQQVSAKFRTNINGATSVGVTLLGLHP